MTITPAAAAQVIGGVGRGTPCPNWCEVLNPASEHLHSRDVPDTWGATGSVYGEAKLGLALEREDGEDGAGEPRINVQFSSDGVAVDGSASLRFASAESYAYTILRLVAEGRSV